MCSRRLVLQAARIVWAPTTPIDRPQQDGAEVSFNGRPFFCVRDREQYVFRRNGIVVPSIPTDFARPLTFLPKKQPSFGFSDRHKKLFELIGRNLRRQREPAIAIAKQDDEVRSWRKPLTAGDLVEADLQRSVILTRLVPHTPAEIDGLEAVPVASAEVAQFWEDGAVEGIALLNKINESGADEDSKGSVGRHCSDWKRLPHSLGTNSVPAVLSEPLWTVARSTAIASRILLCLDAPQRVQEREVGAVLDLIGEYSWPPRHCGTSHLRRRRSVLVGISRKQRLALGRPSSSESKCQPGPAIQ